MGVDNKQSVLRGWSLVGKPSYGEVIAYQTQRKRGKKKKKKIISLFSTFISTSHSQNKL